MKNLARGLSLVLGRTLLAWCEQVAARALWWLTPAGWTPATWVERGICPACARLQRAGELAGAPLLMASSV